MIKAAIFDLGGVYFSEGVALAIEKISQKFKIDKALVAPLFRTATSKNAAAYRRGDISKNDFWDDVKKKLEIEADNDELNAIWMDSFEPIQGTVEILEKLKEKGIKLYFLSDNVKERIIFLENKYHFRAHFITGIFSHEVHLLKFDGLQIFRDAVVMTSEKPEQIAYVDDNEGYVNAAKSIGMKSICFKNPEQLKAELKKLGLEV